MICSMVSHGCTNCYAMVLMLTRLGPIIRKAYRLAGFDDWATRPIWGEKATRVLSKGFWANARRINAAHAKAGTRGRWFPSMIDWLDLMPAGIIDQDGNKLDPIAVLADFLNLIADSPDLDWLLLTKRPELCFDRINAATRCPNYKASGRLWNLAGCVPHNVWIGVSVEDQKRADERIPLLLQIPAKVRFLSVEPLLEPIRIYDALRCDVPIHWVIVGGESGKDRRDCGVDAICDVARQCVAAGVPCFVKQDSAFKPGQQGRLPADVWALKDFPKT
jgi:protein gp37